MAVTEPRGSPTVAGSQQGAAARQPHQRPRTLSFLAESGAASVGPVCRPACHQETAFPPQPYFCLREEDAAFQKRSEELSEGQALRAVPKLRGSRQ